MSWQVSDSELVRTALFGVAPSWAIFVQAIVGRENMPSWDRLWDDFIQEEIRRRFTSGSTFVGVEVEENVALAAKGRGKGKSRKGPTGGGTGRGAGRGTGRGGGKDLTKVKCWHCHEMGHYAVTCPEKKRKGKDPMVVASAEIR